MARVCMIEIEGTLYGFSAGARGNNMMAPAGEVIIAYGRKFAPQHHYTNIQQKSLPAKEIKKYMPEYGGGDVKIDDETICQMILCEATLAEEGEALVIGMRAVSTFFEHAVNLSAKIKERLAMARQENPDLPEVKIVVGGYHSSSAIDPKTGELKNYFAGENYRKHEDALRKNWGNEVQLIDALAVGEGEETFVDLINHFENGESISDVKGVIYQKEGNPVFTGRRPQLHDSQNETRVDLEDPAREIAIPIYDAEGRIVNLENLPSGIGCGQIGSFPGHKDIQNEIGASFCRGCTGSCVFCTSPLLWEKRVRFQDPKKVVDGIVNYRDESEIKPNFIYFYDLSWNTFYSEHGNRQCDEMIAARDKNGERVFGTQDPEKIHWFCLAEIFDYKSGENEQQIQEALSKMAEAGCTKIGYGIEGITPEDVLSLKNLGNGKEDPTEQGIERLAKIAWVLKQTTDKNIFTRGYFIWGTEHQGEGSLEKAIAMLTTEIPDKVFDNFENLKTLIRRVYDNHSKGNLNPSIEELVEGFGLSDEEIGKVSRLLEVDHIRVAYETPYTNTGTAKTRKLRYPECYKGKEGFLYDEKGAVIPKRYTGDQEIKCVVQEDKPHFFLPNDIEISRNDLLKYDLKESKWSGMTLDEAEEKGFDDHAILSQEIPVLESGIPLKDLMNHASLFPGEFYGSEAYQRSMERRTMKPGAEHILEGVYDWQATWEKEFGKKFNFLSDEAKVKAEERILDRGQRMEFADGAEAQEWIDAHFLEGRKPSLDKLREGVPDKEGEVGEIEEPTEPTESGPPIQ